MPLELTPISAVRPRVALGDIGGDICQAVEEALVYCSETDNRLEVKFGNAEAAQDFLHQARSYAYQRQLGRVTVTGNTTKNGAVRFRVTAFVKADAASE